VAKLKYLGILVKNHNLIYEEIKSKVNPGIAYYHSLWNLQFSHLLSRNVKIKIYRIIILLVVSYGCETWPLILGKRHRMMILENKVLREIFGPKRDEIVRGW
jgi:hypothetical protein